MHTKFIAGAFALALAAPFASAQQVGTYTGTTSDGQSMSIDVALDDTGALYISHIDASYTLVCVHTGDQQGWGIGWDGDLTPLVGNKATMKLVSSYDFTYASATFSGNNVKGKIEGGIAEYWNGISSTQSCPSSALTYQATLSTGDTPAAPKAANFISHHVDSSGHVTTK